MNTSTTVRSRPRTFDRCVVDNDFSEFCQDVFASFTRSDQRRWGEVYAQGLRCVVGRKSIRRIAEDVVGWRADQCLQQFLNQSPWDWRPVRRRLAEQVVDGLRPRAWVVEEAVFPKNGNNSVGVAKQFAPSVGAVVNCQLGLAVCLASERGSAPVNWRLMLPRSWECDDERRERTHLPDDQQPCSRWEHVIDAVDEMVTGWGMAPLPLLVAAQHEPDVHPLLAGLEERGLRYLVQVAPNAPVSAGRAATVTDVVTHALKRGGGASAAGARNGRDGGRSAQYAAVNLTSVVSHYDFGSGRAYAGGRRILARWSPRRQSVDAVWLTNIDAPRLADLVALTALGQRTAEDLDRMGDESGLKHFEGRSFRGWHHHMTLSSVAHSYGLLDALPAGVATEAAPAAVAG